MKKESNDEEGWGTEGGCSFDRGHSQHSLAWQHGISAQGPKSSAKGLESPLSINPNSSIETMADVHNDSTRPPLPQPPPPLTEM